MSRLFPSLKQSSGLERFIRIVALFAIFAAVIWAFWENNQRVISEIERKQDVADTGGYLSDEQLSFVKGFRDALHSRYGISFRLRVVEGPVPRPESDQKTLYVGLSPASEEIVLRLPPLLGSALGEEFLDDLRANHLNDFWQDEEWQSGLVLLLAAIWERLEEISGKDPAVREGENPS